MYLFKIRWVETHEAEVWAKDEDEAIRLTDLETRENKTCVNADVKDVQVIDKEEDFEDISYNDEDYDPDPFECE